MPLVNEGGNLREMTPQEEAEWLLFANAPPPVPARISKMQAIFALKWAGLYDEFQTLIAGVDSTTKDYIDLASHWHRDHPKLIELGAALGLDSDDMDNLFRTGELFY